MFGSIDDERARRFATFAAAAAALWGLLYALIGLGILIPSLEERSLQFGWQVMANKGFYYTPIMFRPSPSFCFIYAYLYVTLGFAIYRLSGAAAVIAAAIFVAIQVSFAYYGLFGSGQFNILPAILLVAAIVGLKGTLRLEKDSGALASLASILRPLGFLGAWLRQRVGWD
jgi:hypothetical protein